MRFGLADPHALAAAAIAVTGAMGMHQMAAFAELPDTDEQRGESSRGGGPKLG